VSHKHLATPELRVVQTDTGAVSGLPIPSGHVFRGIPYAAPPTGPRRYRPPQSPPRWDGVRPATHFGPVCPQSPPTDQPGPFRALATPGPRDEDCLYLNVWAPAPDGQPRPVMVWIHGGSFEVGAGSDPLYDGQALLADGVVLVTVNYRLNAFGFLNLTGDGPGAAESGYLGILDQLAALDWVRRNIASFGGDPANVTVFGESAGAMSIGILLADPRARGLFQRAILQSGAAHHGLRPENSQRVGRRLLELLAVRPGDTETLRDLPAARLLAAAETLTGQDPADLLGDQAQTRMPFQPTCPSGPPIGSLATGRGYPVDVLVGTCADEWSLFTQPAWWAPDRSLLARSLPGGRPAVDALLAGYAALPSEGGRQSLLARIEQDLMFTVPAHRLAQVVRASGHTALVYRFAWPTPVAALGACHVLDVPFVFGTLATAADLTGPQPPAQLAETMRAAWVAFATSGRVPGWPVYQPDHPMEAVLGSADPPADPLVVTPADPLVGPAAGPPAVTFAAGPVRTLALWAT
jgi:para-nitrobenzyl esterase